MASAPTPAEHRNTGRAGYASAATSTSSHAIRQSYESVNERNPMLDTQQIQRQTSPTPGDGDAVTPTRWQPRGFFDRMLGRNNNSHHNSSSSSSTPSGGHRSSASMSAVISGGNKTSRPPTFSNPARDVENSFSASPSTSGSRPKLPNNSPIPPYPIDRYAGSNIPVAPSGAAPPPLTINTLSNTERTERVKRNRKLMQILGTEVSVVSDVAADFILNSQAILVQRSPGLKDDMEGESFYAKQRRRHSSPITPGFSPKETILSPRVLRKSFFSNGKKSPGGTPLSAGSTGAGGTPGHAVLTSSSEDDDLEIGDFVQVGPNVNAGWTVSPQAIRSVDLKAPRSAPAVPFKGARNTIPGKELIANPSADLGSTWLSGKPSTSAAAPLTPETPSTTTTNPRRMAAHSITSSITSTISGSTNENEHDEYDDVKKQTAVEADRAKKRATLAKLHRFLGSRVPPELVLGISAAGLSGLPPVNVNGLTTPTASPTRTTLANTHANAGAGMQTTPSGAGAARRSLSTVLTPQSGHFPLVYKSDGELDGPKGSGLTAAQRAHIMRKQRKITKMLGHCPPGALRQQSDLLLKGEFDGSEAKYDLLSPTVDNPLHSPEYVQHRYSIDSLIHLVQTSGGEQLQDLLTYIKADDSDGSIAPPGPPSTKSHSRPSSTQSRPHNLNPAGGKPESDAEDDLAELDHPRSSSNSKHRPPRLSLSSSASQHGGPPSPTDSFASPDSVAGPGTSAGRRGSASIPTASSPNPDGFAARRKRAAKLTSFFGVEYKELYDEVLEVIENEVKEDGMSGSLSPEELQELLVKLRRLRRV